MLTVPRKLRIQYEGAIYHVMNRGDRREEIFENDSDRELFLKTLGEACAETVWPRRARICTDYPRATNKIRIARLLRNQTTMTLKWIAHRLNMGVWTYLSNRLHHVRV